MKTLISQFLKFLVFVSFKFYTFFYMWCPIFYLGTEHLPEHFDISSICHQIKFKKLLTSTYLLNNSRMFAKNILQIEI